jgi:hypothetical protein
VLRALLGFPWLRRGRLYFGTAAGDDGWVTTARRGEQASGEKRSHRGSVTALAVGVPL